MDVCYYSVVLTRDVDLGSIIMLIHAAIPSWHMHIGQASTIEPDPKIPLLWDDLVFIGTN